MKKVLLSLVVIFLISAISHAIVLPQATKCLFVDFYDLNKEGKIYFEKGFTQEEKNEIVALVSQAESRVASFWGEKTVEPKFIFCKSMDLYHTFGSSYPTPASAIMHFGSYVVVNENGVDLDIISHELSHTELFERIGLINRSFKIPVWFDEGLAMQVDNRDYYSIDTLEALSNGFKNLPDVKSMKGYAAFGAGTREEVMMNYSASKYVVANWYSKEVLNNFINKLNNGANFEEAYYEATP